MVPCPTIRGVAFCDVGTVWGVTRTKAYSVRGRSGASLTRSRVSAKASIPTIELPATIERVTFDATMTTWTRSLIWDSDKEMVALRGNSRELKVDSYKRHQCFVQELEITIDRRNLSYNVVEWISGTTEWEWTYKDNTQTFKLDKEWESRKISKMMCVVLYVRRTIKTASITPGVSRGRPFD